MGSSEQTSVITFLSRGSTWGQPEVGRFTTSLSEIFLAGDDAYKLKRPVSLPYVDFSTLEARKAACEREVALNRRLAPELYLGVVPVTREGDGLALGGAGQPVDYLVHMRRFDQASLFHQMALEGRLTDRHITALADLVANFHMGLKPEPGFGGAEALSRAITDVVAGIGDLDTPLHADIAAVARTWQDALKPLARRMEVRRRRGYVRLCHGDLHLANICLVEGAPRPFDCIEFSETIATIDTAFDIAFPAMDLMAHGRPALANLLLNRYLALTQDYHALPLLPLYMAARAIIRASVNALEARQGNDRAKRARDYADLARVLLGHRSPRLVAISGLSGSGKSSLGGRLAPLIPPPPGALWLRTDVLRKVMLGTAPEDRLPESAYAKPVTTAVYQRLMRIAARALRAGWPVLLDGVFLKSDERRTAEHTARCAGAPFAALWLEVPLATRIKRLGARSSDASDADERVARLQEEMDAGDAAWPALKADGTLEEVLKAVRKRLGF